MKQKKKLSNIFTKSVLFIFVSLIFVLILNACSLKNNNNPKELQVSKAIQDVVANYIKANISNLSPQKVSSGTSFYITALNFKYPNTVFIEYEDGYVFLKAQANFEVDDNNVKITNFKLMSDGSAVITDKYLKCNSHDECVPLPGCHTHECINKKYKNNYSVTETCSSTDKNDNCVARDTNDCLCQQGLCFNERLMSSECQK